ncbi:MAG: response regulator [Pseudomonadales bacterium]|nr:response regulator [Pseudomonadales bacterium]
MNFRKLLLLGCLALSICYSGYSWAQEAPQAENGLIDLSDWNFNREGPVRLNGGWEFYWNQFLTGTDLLVAEKSRKDSIYVPGGWNGQEINGHSLPGTGYATYRLNVLVGARQPYALKIPDIGTAYRLYADNQLLSETGKIANSRERAQASYYPAIVNFTPQTNRIELVFLVSNFHHRLGGIWLPIEFGLPEQLSARRENQLARDLLLFGAILIIGLYNIALYWLRRESPSNLYLGLFCIFLAVRTLAIGDRFLTRLLDLPFEWFLRVEYLSWYWAISAFTAFLYSVFPREFNRTFSLIIHLLVACGTLLVLLSPTYVFSMSAPTYQVLTILSLVYGAYCLVLAGIRKREGALILLAAYAILFYSIVNDILVNAGITNNALLVELGLFTFILCQSILISYRFTQSFKTIERQREQLQAANIKLHTQEKLRRDAEQATEALHHRIAQSEKMEAIGLLAGGVAHDLNNILSNTVTYPELVLTDLPESSPLYKPLQLTRQAGLRAAAVIEDLLTLARRGVVSREVLNVNDTVTRYISSVEHKAMLDGRNINVQLSLSPESLNIEGSPVHIEKLLMNLIANAVEAQAEGGTVAISTQREKSEKRQLFYGELKAGEYLVLSVEDEGKGIEPEDLDKVFEPFYTTKVMGQSGTGLGMSVVWGVVHDHNAMVDVMSETGVGTRFDTYLPLTDRQPAAPVAAVNPGDYKGNQEIIMVVDDLQDQRDLLQGVLEKLNYRVITCSSGQEAAAFLTQSKASMVLLDMVINDSWDGLETFRALRKIRPGLPALLMSGFSETDQVNTALQEGAAGFLAKPFTLADIAVALRRILDSETS